MIDLGAIDGWILTALIFFPLIGALVLAFIPSSNVNAIRNGALVVAAVTFLISILLALAFDNDEAGFQFVAETEWIGFFGIEYKVVAILLF